MSKTYLGLNCSDLDYSDTLTRISRVNLILDNDTMYTAGDDTGRTLEVECLWATQEMANSILQRVKDVDYTPYTATEALIDPAAEIGDAITTGGIYNVIAGIDTTFDEMCVATVSAPGGDEIEDEYPYESYTERKTNYELATIRSLITKTAEEILLRVEQTEGDYSELKVTLDGVTITDSSGTTLIKGSSIETGSLTVSAANITGTLSASQINLTGAITWSDLASDAQSKVNTAQSTANSAQSTASAAQSTANRAYNLAGDASDTISAWSYGSTTYIDGNQLMTGTVTATILKGGTVSILTSTGSAAGYMTVSGASTSSYAIELSSYGALRLSAGYGAAYMESGYGTYINLGSGQITLGVGKLLPSPDNTYSCGDSTHRWTSVYASSSAIVTSDATQKHTVNYDLSRYDSLFDAIKPASYEFNAGTSGRTHTGMIAQDIETALIECGLGAQEFAGFIKSPCLGDDGQLTGKYEYALRYEEFIALCIWQIQNLKTRVKALEEA